MTYLQILRLLERYAWAQPDVHSVVREFTDLNREEAQYAAVVIQDRDGERDLISDQDWITYTWHIGYVDRLWEEKNENNYGSRQVDGFGSYSFYSNRDDIYSQGIRVINNIIAGLRKDYDLEITTPDRINTFNQRFTAECAGVYMVIAVTVPVSDCETGGVEDMYDSLNQRFTANGTYHFVPDGKPWNEADIEIDVHPQESLVTNFTENGIYDLEGEWKDATIGVNVPGEKPETVLSDSIYVLPHSQREFDFEPPEGYVYSSAHIDVVCNDGPLDETITSNGSYSFEPSGGSSGIDMYNQVNLSVDVHPSTSLSAYYTENGIYTIADEFNGGRIEVDVFVPPAEQGYVYVSKNGTQDFYPEHPGDEVFSYVTVETNVHPSVSLSETYTSNGTYNISGEFNGGEINVAVPQVSQMSIDINISENGVTGYAPLSGYAFNYVSIYTDVHPHNILSETYTSNGTYNISGEFAGGQVTVAVSSQKPEESLVETITSNGSYSYSPQVGYVFDSVALSVDVHPSTSLSETYVSNGTYNISGEFNGGQVTVSVPQVVDSNVIYYTTSDNRIIDPSYNYDYGETDITEFGANIVSNVYVDNQGVMTFDGPVTIISSMSSDKLTSITIPSSVTVVKGGAFAGCNKLKILKIPPFVTKIGTRWTDGWACMNDTSLVAVEIPPNVTEIYDQSFGWCIDLQYVKLPLNLTVVGDYVFDHCSSLKNIVIPDTFTKLGAGMFRNCGLTSITIPASVTDISLNPFEGCSYAAVVSVNSNNTVYDSRNNCNAIIETATNKLRCGFALTNIPSSVTSIDRDAFRYITTLTSITIPSSVTSIGYYAFGECSNLTEVIVNNTIPPVLEGSGDTVFSDNAQGRLIKVPAASLQDYLNAPGWSYYASSIVAQ